MNKVFEKIIEKLEKLSDECYKAYCIGFNSDDRAEYDAYTKAIEIVKEEATQYNNGWIACSERLPDDDSTCIVTVDYPCDEKEVDYGWFDGHRWYVGMDEYSTYYILAWQPLPEPYQ